MGGINNINLSKKTCTIPMNTPLLTFYSAELHLLRRLTRQTFCPQTIEDNEKLPPHVLLTFIRRHNNGEIDTSFYQEYINFKPLQAQLHGFGIDPDQFFYLIIFFKDYYDTLTIKMRNSAIEDLYEIASLIEQSSYAKVTIRATIPQPQGSGKPHEYDFSSPTLLRLLAKLPEILHPMLQDLVEQNPEFEQPILIEDDAPIKEKITLKQYMFYKTLDSLLESIPPKNKGEFENEHISHDKNLLISRCVGLIGLIDNPKDKEKYLAHNYTANDNKQNILLSNIKKYRQNEPLIKLYNLIYEHALIDPGKDRVIAHIPHKPKQPEQ